MANFTIYFSDYIKEHTLPPCLDVMPLDDNGITFSERLAIRDLIKEIGSETVELFEMHLERLALECVSKYKWKLELYFNNRDKLLDRLIDMNDKDTNTNTGNNTDDGTNTQYYNPIVNNPGTDNIINKTGETVTHDYTDYTEHTHSYQHYIGPLKSNTELMKATLEIDNLYDEALAYFDKAFMGVL